MAKHRSIAILIHCEMTIRQRQDSIGNSATVVDTIDLREFLYYMLGDLRPFRGHGV